ncbi:peroxidase-like isoform X2 [Prorops nasuta]
MAGSVATFAVMWMLLQTMDFLGQSYSIGVPKLSNSIQRYLDPPDGAGIVDTGLFKQRQLPKITISDINESMAFAQSAIDRLATLERNIANANIELQGPAHRDFLTSLPEDAAADKAASALLASKTSARLVSQYCRSFGVDKSNCARYVSTLEMRGTNLGSKCAVANAVKCDAKQKYRSIDGSCNNIRNPSWGRAMTAYTRILFPHYFDGIQEPRHMGENRKMLPGARTVSLSISSPSNQSDLSRTLAVMQWGQFISHDLAHTPVRKMLSTQKPISCCRSDGFKLSPRHVHPDCSPIIVPENDPIYGQHFVRCMNYVRSLPVVKSDCTFGPVEQMNQASHFLDGSMIYGSTLQKSRELRSYEGGKLLVENRNNHDYLPTAAADFTVGCNGSCYNSGDDRVNVQPQLAVMHTIWHREHNRIAEKLAKLNPHWWDEILYQETRRIVIAEIQHITYKEWLPIILGKSYTRTIKLTVGNSLNSNYDPDDEPAVSNEVATAALKFLNSLMQGKLYIVDSKNQQAETLQLSDAFFKPSVIEVNNNFDGLLRGLVTQTSQKMDANLATDLTSKLFTSDGKFGLDSISLDIQRGRDHGLPSYNYYRQHCGLPVAKKFEDFSDHIPFEMVKKLRTTYLHPDDVDLIIGGLAERPAEDGLIGPTFRCLISEQFLRSRRTDRFFYDSTKQPSPFTSQQLQQIRKASLARVFCDNGDNIESIQPNVFIAAQTNNDVVSCQNFEAIPSVDLFAWAEKAKAYR